MTLTAFRPIMPAATHASDTLPMTREALGALTEELRELLGPGDRVSAHRPDATAERDLRIERLRRVIAASQVPDEKETEAAPDRSVYRRQGERSGRAAIIGRRVTVREEDGSESTYALVIPGDGDPFHSWLGVDSPMGSAVLGARAGDQVVVVAPAGERILTVIEVL